MSEIEIALFVGGPIHGTERAVDGHPHIVMEMPRAPLWSEDPGRWPEPERHTYSRRRLWRDVDGQRYAQVAWVHDRIRSDEEAMERLKDAVMIRWFRSGTQVEPDPVPAPVES